MKRFDTTRAAAVIAGLGFAPAALAVEGGMTATGWASLLAVPVVVGILWVVHKRIGYPPHRAAGGGADVRRPRLRAGAAPSTRARRSRAGRRGRRPTRRATAAEGRRPPRGTLLECPLQLGGAPWATRRC